LVLETFRDRLFTEIFPGRSTVPKTLVIVTTFHPQPRGPRWPDGGSGLARKPIGEADAPGEREVESPFGLPTNRHEELVKGERANAVA
jgi:hypothetical protein